MATKRVSRRQLLKIAGTAAGAALAAACGATPTPTPAPTPTPVVVTKVETKVVEKQVPVTQVVEKVVEKVVTATPVPYTGPATAQRPSDKAGEVVMWTYIDVYGSYSAQPDMPYAYRTIIANFNKRYPKVKVKVEVMPWDQIHNKVITAGLAGVAPDIAIVMPQRMAEFATTKLAKPMNDYFATMSKEDLNDFYAMKLDDGYNVFDGKRYAIGNGWHTRFMWYRKDFFEKAGLDPTKPPTDWDQLVEYAKKLTTGKQWGFGDGIKERYNVLGWPFQFIYSNGGRYFDEKGRGAWDSPEAIEAVQFMKDLKDKHKVYPADCLGWTARETTQHMINGDIAMMFEGSYRLPMLMAGLPLSVIGYCPNPAPKGKKSVGWVNSWAWMIPAAAKNPDLGWEVIRDFISTESLILYCKADGSVPPRTSSLMAFTDAPFLFFIDHIKNHGRPIEQSIKHENMVDALLDAIQSVLTGKEDPKTAMTRTAAAFNKLP